jgi:hypothetical protein
MKMRFLKRLGIVFTLLISNSLFGTTIRIPNDQPSIQHGIDAAQVGDTVLVAEGIYFENINYHGKNVIVASNFLVDGDVSHILNTTIDGSKSTKPDTGSCVLLVSGEDSSAVLQGFTITGGTGTTYHTTTGNTPREGGGILISNSSPTVKNNLIISNKTMFVNGSISGGGGGISSFYQSQPNIVNNIIMKNTSGYAGGIVLNWSGGYIKNNIIYQNSTLGQWGSGGIMVWQSVLWSAFVENNTIVGNLSATSAGGLSVTTTSATIRNNIIWGNRQPTGQQVTGLETSVFEYCNTEEPYPGIGNISMEPKFLSDNLLLGVLSQCIDAGAPDAAYLDKENPDQLTTALFPSQGSLRNDIGAYGGSCASVFPTFSHEFLYTPVKLNFNMLLPINVGMISTITCQIINLCTYEITIDSVVVSKESQLAFNKVIKSTIYQPIKADTVVLTWTPVTSGYYNDTLNVYHNAATIVNPIKIPIRGRANFPTELDENQRNMVPVQSNLYQNYPNPFNPQTNISYSLAAPGDVMLKVYDILGKEVKTIINGFQHAGNYTVTFNAADLTSGIYFYELRSGKDFMARKRMVVMH